MASYTVQQVVTGQVPYPADLFWDWFCPDKQLPKRAAKLIARLREVAHSPLVPQDAGVFFKNNCPMAGPLYDDFRIKDADGDVLFTVVPKSGHTGRAELWGKDNGFDSPLADGSWSDVLAWFYRQEA